MEFSSNAALVALVERLSNHIGTLTTAASQADGARMAQRHILAALLAEKPAEFTSALTERLIAEGDAFEEEMGVIRMSSYREELDRLVIQARAFQAE